MAGLHQKPIRMTAARQAFLTGDRFNVLRILRRRDRNGVPTRFAMLGPRMRWNAPAARALLFICATSGCTGESAEPPAPRAAIVAAPDEGLVVVGTVPQATRSSRSVVLLEPHAEREDPVPSEAVLLDQLGRTFIPALLLVRAGQPVVIRNSENDLHNVRIIETATGETLINVGMLMGTTYQYTFAHAGTYTVQCDIHTSMFADIVVATTPHMAVSDRKGNFSLSNVPAGDYTVTVIYGDKQIERVVEITDAGGPLIVEGATATR